MKRIEAEGKTVEEAINTGLAELGAGIGDVDITVLNEGSKGLFGLFGSRMAKVALSLKQEDDMKDAARALFADALTEASPKKKAAPRAESKPERRENRRPALKSEEEPEAREAAEEKPQRPQTPPEPAEIKDPETQEGKAQQFLMELTRLMGVTVSVHVRTDEEGSIRVSMQGDSLGILIGRRGETLDALQYLTSLHLNKGQEGYTRVTLDSEGYRAKREEALVRLANRMANRARKTGRRVSMEPMNPYERRILHSALQGAEGIATHSEGEEPNRHVVITVQKSERQDEDGNE